MLPPGIHISLEYDVSASAPDSEVVLNGLMEFNARHLPPSKSRFVILVGDPETGDPACGMTLVQWGSTAYCFWGAWSVPDVSHTIAVGVLLGLAEAELARRGIERFAMVIRAHDDIAPYLAYGFGVQKIVRDHINGGDYAMLRKNVDPTPHGLSSDGLAVAIHLCLPRTLAAEVWRMTDERRKALLKAPVKLVSAFVRDSASNRPRGGALCYAVNGDFMVDMVWLEESLRGTGTGFQMLATALDAGRQLGCTRAGVETMDCQAPTFYLKHGFQRFDYVETDVPGMNMNFYQMKL